MSLRDHHQIEPSVGASRAADRVRQTASARGASASASSAARALIRLSAPSAWRMISGSAGKGIGSADRAGAPQQLAYAHVRARKCSKLLPVSLPNSQFAMMPTLRM